jgi:hypothetical protein
MTERPDIQTDIEAYLHQEARTGYGPFVVVSTLKPPDGVDRKIEKRKWNTFETLPDAMRAFDKENPGCRQEAILLAEVPNGASIKLASKELGDEPNWSGDFEERRELWRWKSAEGEKQAQNVPPDHEVVLQNRVSAAENAINRYIRWEDATEFCDASTVNPEGRPAAYFHRHTEEAHTDMVRKLAVLPDDQMRQVIDDNQRREHDGSWFSVIDVKEVREKWPTIQANDQAKETVLTIPPEITGVERGQKQTATELWKNPDARREYARQETAKVARHYALDRILEDQEDGAPVNTNNLNYLYTDEVQKVRDGKQPALDKILLEHEQEIEQEMIKRRSDLEL